jgi:hypothetical protein
MPFRLGEHVRATRRGWYGQVVARNGDWYQVRMGGTSTFHRIAEGDLAPIHGIGTVVAPHAFPPLEIVDGGGSFTNPELVYAFSNEKGIHGTADIWDLLDKTTIDDGAFVGVSGSIIDFAWKQHGHCQQILSADINTETVKAVDLLRTVVALFGEVTSIELVKRHWKTEAVISRTALVKSKFFEEVIHLYEGMFTDVADELVRYEILPLKKGDLLKHSLARLRKYCKSKIFSTWYCDNSFLTTLSGIIAQGNFSILCGDLQNSAMHTAIAKALKYPVSLFNFSNAMDYVKQPELVARFFELLPHTTHAKVITSSQVSLLEKDMGTFEIPKVLDWEKFIEIARDKKHAGVFGLLLDKK